MTRSASTAKPRSQVISPFGYPGDKVVAYENVSVTVYASGTRRASHARLDLSTNRMTFRMLSVPSEQRVCHAGLQHDLAEAAAEVLDDAHAQEVLF